MINKLDLNLGTKFYNQVISDPEFKIKKMGEWGLRDDKKFEGTKKPLPIYLTDKNKRNKYKDTVVYFFVVGKSCLYMGQTTSFTSRMSSYASAGRTKVLDRSFIPSGDNKGGATNKKINSKVTTFKINNPNDVIKIYAAHYNIPKSVQLLPNKGEGVLNGEFNIAIPPTKVEKYFLSLFEEIEGDKPSWQSNIDDSIYKGGN